ncbi:MAG: mechanosensitive ion channel family protein [Deltaproteobacteria bacterium]|jgi:small-conductance mechanosensitive channel|nr:mechanosensitive ion channel family protein [Deltaproteobacteria bacterium]
MPPLFLSVVPKRLFLGLSILLSALFLLAAGTLSAQTPPTPPSANQGDAANVQPSSPGEETDPGAPGEGDAEEDDEAEDPLALTPLTQGMDSASREIFWSDRVRELLSLNATAKSTFQQNQELSRNLKHALSVYSADFDDLLRSYRLSQRHPLGQEDILSQLRGLATQLESDLQPLDDLKTEVALRKSELNALTSLVSGQSSDTPSPQETRFFTELKRVTALIDQSSYDLENLSAPGQSLSDRLNGAIKRLGADLPVIWSEYYFTESRLFANKLSRLAASESSYSQWKSTYSDLAIFIFPSKGEDWLSCLTTFLLSIAILAFMGFLLWEASKKLPDNWQKAIKSVVQSPWFFLTLGLSLLLASRNSLGGSFLFFALPGVLILIWAVGSLSWTLRGASKAIKETFVSDKKAKDSSPLTLFYLPAALGVIFLYADVPAGALTLIWFHVMAIFIVKVWLGNRKRKIDESVFPLEKFAFNSAFYFAIVSLFVGVVGYPRIAILVFMLLYTLVNLLILGQALIELGNILCQKFFDPVNFPIKNTILGAFLLPFSCLLSLFCTLPWFKAIPGSAFVIQNFLNRGYSVGDASIDLSKLLLILVLFFLFRSLQKLAPASLGQVLSRFQKEAGFINPIKMLLTYTIWAVFFLIALGLLGVNFTSLALIAGGLSLAIGFGLQTLFNNLISGIILIFGRSVLEGDWVEVGGVSGTVTKVGIRCTTLETSNKELVFVPNSKLVSDQFTNCTRGYRTVRRKLIFLTFHETDIAKVLEILSQVTRKYVTSRFDPNPLAVLNDINEKSMEFNLYLNIENFDDVTSVLSDVRIAVEKAFRQNGVKFYQQSLDVRLDKVADI